MVAHPKRRIILINKAFQFRYAFFTATWILALTFFYPLFIYQLFDYFIGYLALDPLTPPVQDLEGTRNSLMALLIIVHALVITVISVISLFVSHRIAGPLFKLRKTMDEASPTDYPEEIRFRKYDYFKELAFSFNSMIDRFRATNERKENAIKQSLELLENLKNDSNSEKISDAIRTLKEVS